MCLEGKRQPRPQKRLKQGKEKQTRTMEQCRKKQTMQSHTDQKIVCGNKLKHNYPLKDKGGMESGFEISAVCG